MPGERDTEELIRTTVLVPRAVHARLKQLAEAGERPLSWEIRRALEAYVEEREREPAAV